MPAKKTPADETPEDEGFTLLGEDGPLATLLRHLDPTKIAEQTVALSKTLLDITTGNSDVAPDPRDARFKDDAWKTNPAYKRLAQAYIAMTDAVEKMIPDDLSTENKQRADLAASIVTSAMSPTNTLMGNPAAIAKTIETGGANLTKGIAAFIDDLKNNGGLPKQVDSSGFTVGGNLAVTPGKVVLKHEMFELIQYKPSTAEVYPTPVLLIPPQINRFYFTDLAPGRSFAEYTVAQGLHYFAISWRNPQPEHRDWGLDSYAAAALAAMDAVADITGQPKINLVGFCAGGITSAMVMGYLAAKRDSRVNSLALCVTMLDFEVDAALGAFRLPAVLGVAKKKSAKTGILAGADLAKIFTWLRPNDLVWNYWVNNYLMGEPPAAFDILAWNNDSTNMTAQLHQDFLKLFEENAIVQPGKAKVMGEPMDLGALKCDAFVVGAVTDHLTPWKACYRASSHLGSKDVTFALSNGGHVAALVNPPGNPKAYHYLGPRNAPDADAWLEESPKLSGSWWESWAAWCATRSGKQIAAPKKLGSKKFAPVSDAPGEYVKQ
jgi:polyhydroxyalkanoate synthase subunit PhaC